MPTLSFSPVGIDSKHIVNWWSVYDKEIIIVFSINYHHYISLSLAVMHI